MELCLLEMERWTEVELQRVSRETRIQQRTLDACRDVLVEGMTVSESAAKHQMFQPQISRALTKLRDTQAQIGLRVDRENLLETVAVGVGKALLGPNSTIERAQPGRIYDGLVLAITDAFVVQQSGRSGVIHDKGSFERNQHPKQGEKVRISVALDGFARVTRVPEQLNQPGVKVER